MARASSFFRNPSTGELTLWHAPNPAIWVFVAATLLRWTPYDDRDDELSWVGAGALIVWGADELFRGTSPFRRMLGAIVLGWQLLRLFG